VKTVLITGGAGGIGLACAKRFAAAGWTCALVDRAFGGDAWDEGLCFEADVRDRARAEAIVGELKRVDALVTSAGISRDAAIEAMDAAAWKDVIDVDLTGTFNYVAACAGRFKAQGSGKAVLVASTLAIRARRGLANYVAAKSGVAGLVRAAARDLGRYNVNVNGVAPGLVETPLTKDVPPAIKERLREETCLGRVATGEDVAHVIHFLCTEEARHVTGEIVRVDGGQLA
jgi:3-oxoacyl-[acyl-carrier protein] reductase